MAKRIAVVVGSLRKESYNRKMAKALISLSPSSLTFEMIEIGDLPLYNQDLDNDHPPAAWLKIREQIKACEGVLFVTPEYNRSVPGVLKNALDVASRPYGNSAWTKKPCAVISVSPGAVGAFGANQHLRQSFVFLDMPTMQQPEAYIGFASELFNESGELRKEETRKFLKNFMKEFTSWVEIYSQALVHE